MTSTTRKGLIALTVSGLLLGGVGLVGAQQTQAQADPDATVQIERQGRRGFGGRTGPMDRGAFGPIGGRVALGTEVEAVFYDGDPEAGGNLLETLAFTHGEDSEAAFAEAFAAARADAAYLTMNIGAQTRTLDLGDVDATSGRRGAGLPGLGHFGRGLDDGATVTVEFYDGDPEAGGNAVQTLSFTYGEDSAAGFAADVAEAAENASFVTVTTPPTTRTVDLTAAPNGRDGGRDFDRRGPGLRSPGRGALDQEAPDLGALPPRLG